MRPGISPLRAPPCSPFRPLSPPDETPCRARKVDFNGELVDDAGADVLGLLLHLLHEPTALDHVGKAWIVLDVGSDGELAARLKRGDQNRREIGARGIHRRRIASGVIVSEVEHVVEAEGVTVGIRNSELKQPLPESPTLIAIHGGTFSSKYFDLPEVSLLDRATRNGIPVLALDRPGYGGRIAIVDRDDMIIANAERLNLAIEVLWKQKALSSSGFVLIVTRSGGAICIEIASLHHQFLPVLWKAAASLSSRGTIPAYAATTGTMVYRPGLSTMRRIPWSRESLPGPQAMMPSAIAAQVM